MARTKTKWIEDEAVTPSKIGPFSTGTTQKTTPVDADRILIEDSEDSLDKKWATLEDLIGGVSTFGNSFYPASSDGASATGSTTFQNKVTLTETLEAGDYIVYYTAELKHSDEEEMARVRCQFDSSDIAFADVAAAAAGTEEMPWAGFKVITGVTAASHTVTIDWRVEDNGVASIRRARVALWRVA